MFWHDSLLARAIPNGIPKEPAFNTDSTAASEVALWMTAPPKIINLKMERESGVGGRAQIDGIMPYRER